MLLVTLHLNFHPLILSMEISIQLIHKDMPKKIWAAL